MEVVDMANGRQKTDYGGLSLFECLFFEFATFFLSQAEKTQPRSHSSRRSNVKIQ